MKFGKDVTPSISVIGGSADACEVVRSIAERAGWRVSIYPSASHFLRQPVIQTPNCVLADVHLPDIDGLELQARLMERAAIPVIFMCDHCDIALTVKAMKGGAIEFLMKPLCENAVLGAIQHGLALSEEIGQQQSEMELLQRRFKSLTAREREVLQLVVGGSLNKQVSMQLGISEITVKAHRGKVMRKMAASSLAQLVMMATRLDINPLRPKPATTQDSADTDRNVGYRPAGERSVLRLRGR